MVATNFTEKKKIKELKNIIQDIHDTYIEDLDLYADKLNTFLEDSEPYSNQEILAELKKLSTAIDDLTHCQSCPLSRLVLEYAVGLQLNKLHDLLFSKKS